MLITALLKKYVFMYKPQFILLFFKMIPLHLIALC